MAPASGNGTTWKWVLSLVALVLTIFGIVFVTGQKDSILTKHVEDSTIHPTPDYEIARIDKEIDKQLAPLKVDVNSVKEDVSDIKEDIRELRTEQRTFYSEMRREMRNRNAPTTGGGS